MEDEMWRKKQIAKTARLMTYSPYSKFPVGAYIRTISGERFLGCNIENASYGLTNCAERTAIFQGVATCGDKMEIEEVVVYTPTPYPTPPCGACRQVINEFGPKCRVLCFCDSEDYIDTTLDKLLPDAFGPKNLIEE